MLYQAHLLLPVLNLVFVFRYGGLDLLNTQPDAEGRLLQRVLLLPKSLYLLQHPLILLLHLREGSLWVIKYTSGKCVKQIIMSRNARMRSQPQPLGRPA